MPWSSITPWPRLSKRWIPLSIGKITIPRISVRETNCAIQWIVIYPVDSAIHLLINWRLMVISIKFSLVITKIHLPKMVTKKLMTWTHELTSYRHKRYAVDPVHQNQQQIRLDIHIGTSQRYYYKHDCLHKHLGTGIHQNLRQLHRKFFSIVYKSLKVV